MDIRLFLLSLSLVLLLPLACQPTVGSKEPPAPDAASEAKVPERPSPPEPRPTEPIHQAKPRPCEVFEPGSPGKERPNYKQYNPTVPKHCDGTNHQDITKVEKLVFIGDSITAGTPPTPKQKYYRLQLEALVKAKFGDVEVKDCSKWGARTDDLLLDPHKQLPTCLPNDVEPKRTLIVMTIGGNDIQSIAKAAMKGETLKQSLARADKALKLLKDALVWAKDPKRFPNGSFVIFGNVYEYTDGTGDLPSCPASKAVGLDKPWPEGRGVFVHFNETMMKYAVETKTDMVFMLERFCGHGFHSDDPKSECYLGPDAERWFDLTCTHPSPAGHTALARMFMKVIEE